jgi:hypothetical protein
MRVPQNSNGADHKKCSVTSKADQKFTNFLPLVLCVALLNDCHHPKDYIHLEAS